MEKISPIKEKILSFIENKGITKVEFCDKTGISYANLKGKGLLSEIGGAQIGKILSTYTEINPDWLLLGTEPMLREPTTKKIKNDTSITSSKIIDNQDEDSNNNANIQENTRLITELLERLEKQSEVIGVLKSENKQLRNQLAEKNTYHGPDAADAICADAV